MSSVNAYWWCITAQDQLHKKPTAAFRFGKNALAFCVSLNPVVRMPLFTIISNVLSGRLGFRKIKYFGLNTLENGVSNKRTRAEDLNTN